MLKYLDGAATPMWLEMVLTVTKKDYDTLFQEILNIKGHLNCITGSRVTAILLNGWIFPIDGALAVEGLLLMGRTPSSLGKGKCDLK